MMRKRVQCGEFGAFIVLDTMVRLVPHTRAQREKADLIKKLISKNKLISGYTGFGNTLFPECEFNHITLRLG